MASVLLVSVALSCVQHVQNTEHPTYHPTDTHRDRYTMYSNSIGTETNPNMIIARKLTMPTRNNNLFKTNTRQASASNFETGTEHEETYGKSNYAITPEKLLDTKEYMGKNKEIEVTEVFPKQILPDGLKGDSKLKRFNAYYEMTPEKLLDTTGYVDQTTETIEDTRMHVLTVSPKEILPENLQGDSTLNEYYKITPETLLHPKEYITNHDSIESGEVHVLEIAPLEIVLQELGRNLKMKVSNQQLTDKQNIDDTKFITVQSSNHKLGESEAVDNKPDDNYITNKQINNVPTTSNPLSRKTKKSIDHTNQIRDRINSEFITQEEHTTTSNPTSAEHSFTNDPTDSSNNNNEEPISAQDYAPSTRIMELSSTESSLVTNLKNKARKLSILSSEYFSLRREPNLFIRPKRISQKGEFTTLTNAPMKDNLVTQDNLVQKNTIDSRTRRYKELFSAELNSTSVRNHMPNSSRTEINHKVIDDSSSLVNETNQLDSPTGSISHLSSPNEQIATTPEHFTSKTTETKSNQRIPTTHITQVYDAFDRKFVNATDKIAEFSTSQFNDIANDTLLLNNTNRLMVSFASSSHGNQSEHLEEHSIINMSKLDLTTNPISLTTVPSTILYTKELKPMNFSDFDLWDYQSNSSLFDDVTSTPASLNTSASGVWPVKHSAVVEGDLILGGLMMVHEREDSITCGPIMPQGGVQALEAMLYTLDRINENQTILPNVTIGAHILDDCDKDTYGLEMAVDFIKGSISNIDGAEYHCNKTQVRKVISGVVGAASSVTSIQVANLLRLFKIPQVSFFSTSPELSNKQRFEFFSRTIPSDHYQVKAMVDIVRLLNWSYVSIIYEESNYGIKAFEELEDLLQKYDICIAVKEKLVKDSGVAGEKAYDIIVHKLLTKPRARGAIVFGSDQEVAGVMRAVRRSNATGSFSWIGSDGWSARSLVSDGNEAEVEGTLSVQPQANPVQGFEEYFLGLTVENNRRNPWFVEFWEAHFHCRYPNSSKTPYNSKYKRLCTARERLSKQNTVFEDQLQFVSDAVMAFAYAIRDMHKDLCNGRPGLCDAMKPTKGTELLKYLRKVDFQGLSGDWFRFDLNGDGPARYNIIHFKQVAPGKYRWIRVGEYIEGALNLNMTEIQFKLGHPKPPESVCSLPCDMGQAKKYVEGEMCCWHCFNCTQYQIRHATDETQCVVCLPGTLPDSTHVYCNDIPEEFLRPESGWAIGAMALSFTGILVTMFVAGVFIRFNDTPVVRASGRELSYVLLAGILMCYCVTFALVMKPTDIVCGIQRFGAGFCFTVVYAALLTKTNRISRIFNAGKHSAKRPSFISPRSQLIICSFMVFVQMIINGAWVLVSPARAIHHYPTREDNLLVCSSHVDASYMIAFGYPIFLIVICTIYAVLTRKIPEAFNESKHIGFTMYTTCVIWLAFVPLYFGTANNVALRITSMSVTISLSASVTVACLFSPKLYIILIRPERNVRQSMMPVRYSAINKSSGTTNSGAGSMMAAVRVTAVTCNQQSQIQKLVPEKDNIELSANGKTKPVMVDSGTQTVAPPPVNGNLHNTDEQKLNNNCTPLGNGPLLTQLKDVTL